jgi:glycosyltransferase involved in cell wall biosynthesis
LPKINILHIISSGGFFGAENALIELACALEKTGLCSVTVGVFDNLHIRHMEVEKVCREKGLQTIAIPCNGKFDLNAAIRLRQFIVDHGISAIHSHGYKSNLYSLLASLNLPIARFCTCHNWPGGSLKMRFYEVLDRVFLRKFDTVFAVSDDVKSKIIESGVSSGKVKLVHNGIDADLFRKAESQRVAIRRSLGIPEDAAVIGTVGRISTEKGHRHLLGISGHILSKFPDTRFLLIGDGPLRETLENEFGSPSVIFTGLRRDVPDLLRCMDIFVLPSLTEGLPMAILEAMAAGLPVVATRVGDVPQVLIEKETGLIVEPGDESRLEDALLCLLSDPGPAVEMGRKGSERVRKYFSSERMAEIYLGVYRKQCREEGTN